MAVDPKLLVIKPVNQLQNDPNPLNSRMLSYDGSNNLKLASLQGIKNSVSSGVKGEAVPSTVPTPWASGNPDLYEKYDVKTAGTYANFKDSSNASIIVTDDDLENRLVQFWVKNGVTEKVVTTLVKLNDEELNPASIAKAETGKSVANFYEEKTSPDAFSKTLVTTGTIPFTTVFIDSNNDEWILGFGSNTFYIYKNGELFHQRALNQNEVSGFAAYKIGDIFHILLASTQLTGARYLTFDVSALSINELTKLDHAQYIRFNNVVDFNGVLYVAVNQVSGPAFIDLYKLNGSNWQFVKTLADDTIKWGEKWTGDSSVSGATFYAMVGSYIKPATPVLSVEKGALILSFIADSESVSDRYFVYSMRSTNGIDFTQYDMLDWNRGYEIGSYVTEKGDRYYFGTKWVDAYANFKLAIMLPNKKPFYIVDFPIALKKFFYKDGKLLIAFADGNTLKYISLDHKKAEDVINGFGNRFLNEVFPNSILPTNLNIGDYVLAQSFGSYTNFIEHRYHGQTVYIDYPVELNKGDKAYLVWNGLTWNKRVFEENSSGIKNYTPFENVYRHNEFFSKAFRIPVATITEKGTIIVGTDVRYTRGEDYDVIDVGVARSLNNGKSWTDYKIAMARPDKSDGKRIHDVGLTVDRNKGSVNYGRIWMISKFWDANITPLNTTYWKDNSSNLKFYQCYSDDDGVTWSDITELSNVYSVPNAYHWSSGANAGITLNDGTLIQPMYWGFQTGNDRAGFIYKLPNSSTWQVGDLTPNTVVANENQIIQNVDGKLIMVARSDGATKSVFELTTIGGGWIRRTDLEANLSEVQFGCQSSFIRYRNTYLVSKPKGLVDGYKRTEITVYYSYDMITWTELITLTNIPGLGYSSLVCDDSFFGVAYEQNITPNNRIDYSDLNYLRGYLK